jgi:hypothetical protein
LSAGGGWANGDAAFVGSNPPDDAVITYYLQKRRLWRHEPRGVRRVRDVRQRDPNEQAERVEPPGWSMRVPPPNVPPAASAAFGAVTGPRLLPGRYTLKLTEGDHVYDRRSPVADPRR